MALCRDRILKWDFDLCEYGPRYKMNLKLICLQDWPTCIVAYNVSI